MSGDLSSMDQGDYQSQLNDYQSSLNTALESVSGANKTAQEKANRFNEILQASTGAVGAPLIAKGVGKSLGNIKKGLTKQAGEKLNDLKQAAQDKLDELGDTAKSKVDDLVNKNPASEEGDIPNSSPVKGVQETNMDEAMNAHENPPDEPAPQTEEDLSSDAPKEDPFQAEPDDIPLDPLGGLVEDAGGDAAGAAAAAGTDAGAAAGIGGTIETGAEVAAASQGFLDPILDLAPLVVGLGLTLTGLFKKKHAKTIPPPPAINPSFQFGQ
jgi:hypothetical protein